MSKTEKSRATANRISAAAAHLFLERGFDDTNVADVAAASGVATGTVLLHFESKSALATVAFASNIADAVRDAATSLPDGTAMSQIRHVVRSLYGWYDDHHAVASTLLRESLFASGAARERYADTVSATVNLFTSILTDADADTGTATSTASNTSTADDPALLAEGILADYLLVLLQGLAGDYATIDDQVDRFVALASLRRAQARL